MSQYPQEKIKPYNEDESKVVQVEKMFDTIAPAYDNLNHMLSCYTSLPYIAASRTYRDGYIGRYDECRA